MSHGLSMHCRHRAGQGIASGTGDSGKAAAAPGAVIRLSASAGPESLEARDRLVIEHVALVKALANRLARRIPAQVDLQDLIGVGVLGLIDAAGRYRPSLGVPFDAFARRRIQGAMLDSLRDLDWVPRSLRRMRRDFDRAIAQLQSTLGREPDAGEIACVLNISETEYRRRLDQLRHADLAVVREIAMGAGAETIELALDPADGPHACLERQERREQLARAVAGLPARERRILALYFQEELTLAEIGQTLGVGESRVSQLRTQAIGRLRATLGVALTRTPRTRNAKVDSRPTLRLAESARARKRFQPRAGSAMNAGTVRFDIAAAAGEGMTDAA